VWGQEQRAGAGQRHIKTNDNEPPLAADLHLEPLARDAADVPAGVFLCEELPLLALHLIPEGVPRTLISLINPKGQS
jgi:hypothetical protein